MAMSCPTNQARSVAAVSSNTWTAMTRCRGEKREMRPSRYMAGWRARYNAITTTLAPSMNSVPPPRT